MPVEQRRQRLAAGPVEEACDLLRVVGRRGGERIEEELRRDRRWR